MGSPSPEAPTTAPTASADRACRSPASLTVGASWDPQAAAAYGTMLGSEFHRTGLSGVLGPVIDIDRTWHTGREQENFGEDPFLTGSLVAPEVRAIQAQGVMTTVKHCCAYTQEQGRSGQALSLSNPNDTGENELVSERALEEIYGPPWQAAVAPQQGNAMSVMCGYAIVNAADGPPVHGRRLVWQPIHPQRPGQGPVRVRGHVHPRCRHGDARHAAAELCQRRRWRRRVAHAGPARGDRRRRHGDGLTNADGSQNIISQARLVDEVRRLVLQSVKDERFLNPPTNNGISAGITPDEATSAKLAEEGAVLLRISGDVLPLDNPVHSIAVIGTQAGPNRTPRSGRCRPSIPRSPMTARPFVDPTNLFTDTVTGQKFGYSSALSGIVARAGLGPDGHL